MIITHIVYFFKENWYNESGDIMKTIESNINGTSIINKSKFISFLIKVNNEDDIKKELDKINKEYKDADHICYGYIVNNKEYASDNGEPSGTAGLPILNILKKNDLNDILAVVVRYFGGIKLGANGLIRAYSSCVNDLVKDSILKDIVDAYKVNFSISYDKVKVIDKLLKDSIITYKEFDINVIYEAIIKVEDIDIIKNNSINYNIIDKIKTSF